MAGLGFFSRASSTNCPYIENIQLPGKHFWFTSYRALYSYFIKKTILYFVSGHGFGHISRSSVIIKELLNRNHKIVLISNRNSFLEAYSHPSLTLVDYSFDVGLVQRSSLAIDFPETLKAYDQYQAQKKIHSKFINQLLFDYSPAALLSDCAALPLSIAGLADIPALFIGNFSWDFIYRHYNKLDSLWGDFADELAHEYSYTSHAFILPFSCPMNAFKQKTQTGLIGRVPTESRENMRTKLNFEDQFQYLLLSFGAYGLDFSELKLEDIPPSVKLISPALPGTPAHPQIQQVNGNFTNLLQACDAVLTKPGYGILAEAHATNTPVLYTDRGDFIEYRYLLEAMNKHHRAQYISQEDLYSMNIEAPLINLLGMNSEQVIKLKPGLAELVKQIEHAIER